MRYLLSFLFITIFSLSFGQNSNQFRQVDKLNQVYYHISNTYVDSINEHEIVYAAIVEMLDKLDPHSVYIPAKNVNETE